LSTVVCAVLLAALIVVMHFARSDGKDSTTAVMTAAPKRAVAVEHVEPARASRSAAWARAQIEQLPIEAFASSTTAAPPTTARPIVTTAVRRPATTTTTTARPRPTTTAAPPGRAASAPPTTSESNTQSGRASWYDAAPAGTCAHRTLPKGTMVTVTRVSTGASTVCRVADRGPYANGWILDLSKANFSEIGSLDEGVIDVRLTW
jgi:rare lipoprotein A